MKKLIAAPLALLLVSASFFVTAPAYAAGDPSSWIKAATFIPQSSTDFSSSNFQQAVQAFKATGGNYVNFVVTYYQSNTGTTDIGPGWNTPTDDSLAAGIQYVHSLGLHAQISIYLETDTGDWRAYINPSDRTDWYQNYGNVLVHYAQIAQQQGVEIYMLGAELIDMTSAAVNSNNTNEWETMISRVRAVYTGALTYSANRAQDAWGDEADNIGFWSEMTYVGMSAYYGLFGDGSVASMESDWQDLSDSLISPLQRFGKPVLFTEIGYQSVTGAHNEPWNSTLGGSYDPDEQVRDYTALLDFWSQQPWMDGVELWWWNPDPNYGGNGNTDYTPQNKPVMTTLTQWWSTDTGTSLSASSSVPAAFSTSGSADPTNPSVGQATTLTATVTDTSNSGTEDIVDMEVYNGSSQVFQQFALGQNFTEGQTQQYNVSWTPNAAGTYTFKIGIFSGDWSQNYSWNDSAATITVGSTTTTPPPATSTPPTNNPPPSNNPPPTQASAVMDVWWPTNNVHISGLQPFKALLENTDPSQYSMYWQVDNGALVPMADNATDWPHKEAEVDLSGWNWNGDGPYNVNFVAKDTSGNILTQQSMQIFTP